MNKMKFIKLLKKKNVIDAFTHVYSKLKYDAIKDGGREGWEWKIILSELGTVSYMYNEREFIRADVNDGTAIVLASINSIQTVDEEYLGEVEDTLNVEEYSEFVDFLMSKYCLEYESDAWDYFTWENICKFDKNIYMREKKKAWNIICMNTINSEVDECIKDAIEILGYI